MKFTAGEHQSVVVVKTGGVRCEKCGQEARDFDRLRRIDCSSGGLVKSVKVGLWENLLDVSVI